MIESYWPSLARAIKRAVLGRMRQKIGETEYILGYDARTLEEEPDYPLLRNLAKGKVCVFDVGANIGRTSLLVSQVLGPGGKVFAFEASEYACRAIIENAYLNRLDQKIIPVNAIVGTTGLSTQDFQWEFSSGGASTVFGYLGHTYTMKKAVLCLDAFVKEFDLHPDLVKVDVEGAELDVLNGMKELLRMHRPFVHLEVHSWEGMSLHENVQHIVNVVESVSYKPLYTKLKTYISQSTQDLNMIPQHGKCYLLLLPTEYEIPPWLQASDLSDLP